MNDQKQKNLSTLTGTVVSNKMCKTLVVHVENRVKHPVYGKFLKRKIKLFVHDENQSAGIGDMVLLQVCRPHSKNKHHLLIKIVGKAQ